MSLRCANTLQIPPILGCIGMYWTCVLEDNEWLHLEAQQWPAISTVPSWSTKPCHHLRDHWDSSGRVPPGLGMVGHRSCMFPPWRCCFLVKNVVFFCHFQPPAMWEFEGWYLELLENTPAWRVLQWTSGSGIEDEVSFQKWSRVMFDLHKPQWRPSAPSCSSGNLKKYLS